MLGTTKFVPGSSTDRPREECHAFDELWLLVPLVLRLVTGRVRGFAGDGHPLLIAIRHRPCAALLRALARRLSPPLQPLAVSGGYTPMFDLDGEPYVDDGQPVRHPPWNSRCTKILHGCGGAP